ncbi:MAG: nitroreductase family protein [Steroidobacteraceae bacterium]
MIKGSDKRISQYPVNSIFIDRWSPRAMSGATVTKEELHILFEAARWAASANNVQPWRILYARRDTPYWPIYLNLLFEGNRTWARCSGALLLFVSHTFNEALGKPSVSHSFDTGAAWQNLALQGFQSGLVVHGMGGFDREQARELLKIPGQYHIEMMVAVGRPGATDHLPERLRVRESPSDRRLLAQTVHEGVFGL